MDFKDYRTSPDAATTDENKQPRIGRYRGKRFYDFIEEMIEEARERGDFENLPGTGKPLNLDDNSLAGEKAAGYRLLKSNGYAPPEIELLKEIRRESQRLEQIVVQLAAQGKALRKRRVPPFDSERRAYNASVEKVLSAYETKLRDLNRKILTFNLTVPATMHLPMLEVEKLVQQAGESCPLLSI